MNIESPLQSTISNFITSYLNLILAVVTGIIVTRALGPEMKGEYTNYRLLLVVYVPLMTAGYMNGVLFYGLKKNIDIREYFLTGFFVITMVTLVIVPLVFASIQYGIFGDILKNLDSDSIALLPWIIPVFLYNAYSGKCLRVYSLFRVINRRLIIATILTLLFYAIFWYLKELNLYTALLGLLFGQIVQFVLNIYFLVTKVHIKWKIRLNGLLRPWNYGVRSWLNQFLAKANDRFDQIILSFLLPVSSFGVYTVGVGLSNMLLTVPDSYSNVFLNQVTASTRDQGLLLFARAQRVTFLITSILALGLALIAYPVVLLFYGEAFQAASWVVVAYTPGLIFQVAARLSIKFYAGQDKPLKSSLIYLAGIVVSLPVYFILIPKFQIVGAALASSLAYLAAFLFSAIQINREFGLSLAQMLFLKREDWTFLKTLVSRIGINRSKANA